MQAAKTNGTNATVENPPKLHALEHRTTSKFEQGDLVRVHEGGKLRSFIAKIPLSERAGEIQRIQGKDAITKKGYMKLNKVASINLVNAPSLFYEGKEVSNPLVLTNPETRSIEFVAIRKLGIGFSPVGNVVIVDKTIFFNIYTYFLQALFKKVKGKNASNGGPGMIGTSAVCPMAPKGKPKKVPDSPGEYCVIDNARTYIYKPIEPGVGIWIDLGHGDIQDCIGEHIQRQRFAERLADAFVSRNVLKDHPAIGVEQVEVNQGYAWVTVYGWRNELTEATVRQIAKEIDKEVPEGVTVERDVEEAQFEDVQPVEETEFVAEADTGDSKGKAAPDDWAEGLLGNLKSDTKLQIKKVASKKGVDLDEFVKQNHRIAGFDFINDPDLLETILSQLNAM